MNFNIVILNGNPKSGKNTFAELCEGFSTIEHISYVDFTRNMLDNMGINYHGKTPADRQLLENINDALEKHSDIPFLDICRYTENLSTLFTGILFVDIRKPENIKRYVERFPQTVTVFVDNGKPATNVTFSDSVVKNMKYDYTISNTGTIAELKDKAKMFVEYLTEKETKR